jgi:hypothetical protein
MAILQGSIISGSLGRTSDTVTITSNTASIDFSDNDNFIINAGSNFKFDWTVSSDNVGQSGTIIINNTSTSTPDILPSITKTPDGADILFVTASNTTSVLSYYIAATDKVLVSYIGNFA